MNPHLTQAQMLLQQGRTDLAITELRKRLAEHADDGVALAMLAVCMVEKDQPVEAQRIAKAAVAAEPELAMAHYALGVAGAMDSYSVEKGERKWWKQDPNRTKPRVLRSIEHLREAIRLDPDHPGFYATLARLEMAIRRLPEAQATVEQGLRLDPDDAGCNALLVELLEMRGKATQAELASRRALGSNPDDASAQERRGWAQLRRGEVDAASANFAEALRLNPGSDSSRLGLIEAVRAQHGVLRGLGRATAWTDSLFHDRRKLLVTAGAAALAGAGLALLLVYGLNWLPEPGVGRPGLSVMASGLAFGMFCVVVSPLAMLVLGKLFNLAVFFDERGRLALTPAERVAAWFLPMLTAWLVVAYILQSTAAGWSGWAGQVHLASAFVLMPVACAVSAIPSRVWVAWAIAAVGVLLAVGLVGAWRFGVWDVGYGWAVVAVFWSVFPLTWAGRPLEAGAIG